jgi:prophage regulatory protein
MDEIPRARKVFAATGLSRSGVYQLIAQGKFSRPVSLGDRSVGWRSSVIQDWIESRPIANQPAANNPQKRRAAQARMAA